VLAALQHLADFVRLVVSLMYMFPLYVVGGVS
jgi:hypothetical protein